MNDSQLSPMQGETPVQGEITDRLLTGQVLPSSRTVNKTTTAITVVILLLLALLAIGLVMVLVNPFAKSPVVEWPDLNMVEYKKKLGIGEMNPLGASHIYYKQWKQNGELDTWIRMDIPSNSYESLLAARERQMNDPRFVGVSSRTMQSLRKLATRRTDIPNPWLRAADKRWSQAKMEPPLWWEPKNAGASAKCTKWEVQETPEMARGWYWVYDPEADPGRLWIWEWRGRARLGSGSSGGESL